MQKIKVFLFKYFFLTSLEILRKLIICNNGVIFNPETFKSSVPQELNAMVVILQLCINAAYFTNAQWHSAKEQACVFLPLIISGPEEKRK